MTVRNIQKEAMPSSITLRGFGDAMASLDLSSVPPEKRRAAVFDHLIYVMSETVTDPAKAHELSEAHAAAKKAR